MPNPDPNDQGAPPNHIHVGPPKKSTNWLAWLLLAAGIIAALVALSRCSRDRTTTGAVAPVPAATDTAPAPVAPAPAAVAGVSAFGPYVAGTDPLPRTFTFERLNFDTAKSEIRPADRDEIDAVAGTLKQHPNARVRIVGFADARGPNDANSHLGKARADSVKAALVASGIEGARIDTASGGETDPVASNATATGQAENRRTELVVVQR